MFKKTVALLLTLMLPCSVLAADELNDRKVANGYVDASESVQLTAPYSGTVLQHALRIGDEVAAGDTLMTLMTQILTAPADGKVTAVFVQPGEDASAATAIYGAAVSMEESYNQVMDANTLGAYNDDDNKQLHVGETLYFKSDKANKTEGSGIVTMVQGKAYRVEIREGHFDLNEQLTLYRSSDYKDKEKVGKGTVQTKAPLSLTASGIVTELLVQPGDTVAKGQALLRLTSADADWYASPGITAPEAGVITQIAAASGQQVWKGQLLMKLASPSKLEIVAEIDEADLRHLQIGDFLPVTLDMDPEKVLQGQITSIAKVGVTRQNAAYFDVHLKISGADLTYGASASVYLPKD